MGIVKYDISEGSPVCYILLYYYITILSAIYFCHTSSLKYNHFITHSFTCVEMFGYKDKKNGKKNIWCILILSCQWCKPWITGNAYFKGNREGYQPLQTMPGKQTTSAHEKGICLAVLSGGTCSPTIHSKYNITPWVGCYTLHEYEELLIPPTLATKQTPSLCWRWGIVFHGMVWRKEKPPSHWQQNTPQ